jgi:hypothetical protein
MLYVHYFYAFPFSASFPFGFAQKLQTAENTIFWDIEIMFHSGLDGV